MKFPVYRYLVIDGVCRQDVPGGRWIQLSLEETDELLSRFDGLAPVPARPSEPRKPLPAEVDTPLG